MADTSIEWTDAVWNPVTGCTRVSAGCDHCYAVVQSNIRGSNPSPVMQRKYAGLTVLNKKGDRHFNGIVRTHDDALQIPLKWRKGRRVFVNSMSDLFHKDVPFEFIDRVFAVMALCPQHTFQVLTKRPERMAEYLITRTAIDDSSQFERSPQWYQQITRWLDGSYGGGRFIETSKSWDLAHDAAQNLDLTQPLPNVWIGTSVENQKAADERIPHLLKCPAAVRFLSCEPLLGPINLQPCIGLRECNDPQGGEYQTADWIWHIDWVIAGGESGRGARPMHPDWPRTLRDQCQAAGVPFFFKQWGDWIPYEEDPQPPFLSSQHGDRIDGHSLPGDLDFLNPSDPWSYETFSPSDVMLFRRVGKGAAGRLLDGRTWDELPEVRA